MLVDLFAQAFFQPKTAAIAVVPAERNYGDAATNKQV